MHARDREEDYVQSAIKAGYKVLGFSDHTPWHYDTSFVSKMRMREEQLENYCETVLSLKEKYKDQITIKLGLECECFPKYMDWLSGTIKKYKLDYIILGNHYEDTDETGVYFGRQNMSEEKLTKYVTNCLTGIKSGIYSYVAHPDLINTDTSTALYREQMTKLCEASLEADLPLEFNLLGLASGRNYPNRIFWEIARDVGNTAILGVDAHDSNFLLESASLYKIYHKKLTDWGFKVTEKIKCL